ncbi:hypothetical protein SORBI_3002G005400 [Sorghum bicolor]|uniref:Dirigent protein n=2 Tax=Sorghum bicolor TaxID=4558 RepID=A0A1W0W1N0_SORBI|nr:hypothetical protein SORBI_3002G005400 [Sorghum bicolor]
MAAAAAAMASSLLPVLLLVVALSSPPWVVVVLAADADDGTTHLHFFMHDIVAGSNPTAVQVVKGPAATGSIVPGLAFGDTTVIDDALTETSSPTSAAVGRAQGFYMMSSQSGLVLMVCANLLLTTGDHNGSTLAVVGRDDVAADVRELSVVGGTGKFRMATGYVLWKTSSMSGPDATIELDVHVRTTATAATGSGAAIDGGGGSITTGASSAAGAKRVGAGWVSACVVAVVVAVVGSGVW